MSPEPSGPTGRRRPPTLFELWDREVVKNLALVLFAVPIAVSLGYLPAALTGQGSLPRLLAVLAVSVLLFVLARWVLRRWVARGGHH